MTSYRKLEARASSALFTAVGVLLFALCSSSAYPADRFERTYTATAYINVLSIPIFSRSGVGFGTASAQESGPAADRAIDLEFISGSFPARAHGLNRFGFIREHIRERDGKFSHADYFGLMTASDEQSLTQAKAALESGAERKTAFVASQATVDPGEARWAVRHVLLAGNYREAGSEQLAGEIRASFLQPEAGEIERRKALHGAPMGTFLYSLREAMTAGGSTYSTAFLYNGTTFQLNAEMRQDQKAGRELQRAEVTSNANAVMQLDGTIINTKTEEATAFRLWFDNTSAELLPLRFEFRPKPYLRLVFTAAAHRDAAGQTLAAK